MSKNDHSVITSRIEILEKERLRQGDILMCSDFYFGTKNYLFPYIYVLTQDCDLSQDYKYYIENSTNRDKILETILVCPLFFFGDFIEGTHIKIKNNGKPVEIKKMAEYKGKGQDKIRKDEYERYHYIKGYKEKDNEVLPELVMDFKFFFTISRSDIYTSYNKNYVCSVSELFREQISHRFANFISRIGLPELDDNLQKSGEHSKAQETKTLNNNTPMAESVGE